MNRAEKDIQVELLRKLQVIAPITMMIVAVLVYYFWQDDMAPFVCVGLVMFGVLDYFVLKFLADTMRNS